VRTRNEREIRWTVRFSNEDDLAATRALALCCARLDGTTAGQFLRLAVERFVADRYGVAIAKALVELNRDRRLHVE
jgi:hypothetical protein